MRQWPVLLVIGLTLTSPALPSMAAPGISFPVPSFGGGMSSHGSFSSPHVSFSLGTPSRGNSGGGFSSSSSFSSDTATRGQGGGYSSTPSYRVIADPHPMYTVQGGTLAHVQPAIAVAQTHPAFTVQGGVLAHAQMAYRPSPALSNTVRPALASNQSLALLPSSATSGVVVLNGHLMYASQAGRATVLTAPPTPAKPIVVERLTAPRRRPAPTPRNQQQNQQQALPFTPYVGYTPVFGDEAGEVPIDEENVDPTADGGGDDAISPTDVAPSLPAGSQTVTGQVTAMTGSTVTVSTPQGPMTFVITTGTDVDQAVQVGDSIQMTYARTGSMLQALRVVLTR